jgi:hypothetical protein
MDTQINVIDWRKVYVSTSLCLSMVFAVVGMIFLFIPESVFLVLNNISRYIGFAESPLQGFGLYQVLAVGYMYLVTLLSFLMHKHPENTFFPILLIQGKSASSLISLFLYFFHLRSLLLLTNGIVDGIIAVGVFVLYRKIMGIQK